MTTGLIGVSLKAHLIWEEALRWFGELRDRLARPALDVFVCPPYPLLALAVQRLGDAGIEVGAQDVSRFGPGAHTGDVPAAMLAEIGVRYAGLVPVVCVGEARPMPVADAASSTCAQLRNRLAELPAGASVVVAYEPEWAIGADRSADPQVVRGVTAALREVVGERDRILYGGSASRGAFTALCDAAATAEEVPDGLFVGRAALKVNRLRAIVDEVALRSVPHVR